MSTSNTDLDLLQRLTQLFEEVIESNPKISGKLNELTERVSNIRQKRSALQVQLDALIARYARPNDVNEKINKLDGVCRLSS
ncbi:hypothetical protein Hanom_Chr09g00825951 [Helianthus anomalus]